MSRLRFGGFCLNWHLFIQFMLCYVVLTRLIKSETPELCPDDIGAKQD